MSSASYIKDDVIELVNESPAAHGIFDAPTETTTPVFCRVRSLQRSEFWRAEQNGLEPRYVFELSEYADYDGQKIVLYEGERYRVVRSYVAGHTIELTVAVATVDRQG